MPSERDPAADVIALVLDGLSFDTDLDELEETLRLSHRRDSTFPAEALLELAADAYVVGGWTRRDRLVVDELDRLLPERPARGNVGHSKRRHGIHAAIMISAGAEPADTSWWTVDDRWVHALDALVIFVRSVAGRREMSLADVCELIRLLRQPESNT